MTLVVPPARPTEIKEGRGREIEMAVRLRTLPATSGILAVKYAEVPKRYVSRLTFGRVAKFRASAAAAPMQPKVTRS